MKKPETVIICLPLEDAVTLMLMLYRHLLDLHNSEVDNSEECDFITKVVIKLVGRIAHTLEG